MAMTEAGWAELRRRAVLLEDEAVLALDKPAGISVMGERHGTDLMELAEASGEKLYPVHRVDKVTSGVILLARDLAAHGGLTRQFNKQTVDKTYLVITRTTGLPERGTIDLPLSVGRKNRVRIAAPREAIRREPGPSGEARWSVAEEDVAAGRNYPSLTHFRTLWSDAGHSLLAVVPVSGRRHQIRVHLAWTGHPILGDPLFDKTAEAAGLRTHLHSWRLACDATWLDGRRLTLEAPPGPDYWSPLADALPPSAIADILAEARTAA